MFVNSFQPLERKTKVFPQRRRDAGKRQLCDCAPLREKLFEPKQPSASSCSCPCSSCCLSSSCHMNHHYSKHPLLRSRASRLHSSGTSRCCNNTSPSNNRSRSF